MGVKDRLARRRFFSLNQLHSYNRHPFQSEASVLTPDSLEELNYDEQKNAQ